MMHVGHRILLHWGELAHFSLMSCMLLGTVALSAARADWGSISVSNDGGQWTVVLDNGKIAA